MSSALDRRSLIQGGLASTLLGVTGSLNPMNWLKNSPRPNILLIMADDLGVECLRSYGGIDYKTPVLNALASEGTQWNNCFSTPLCTPSRVQILTGRYPFRTGWKRLIDKTNWPIEKQCLNPHAETTFGNLLRDAGYRTGIAGKWQLCHFANYPRHAKVCGFDEHLLWFWKEPVKNIKRTNRYWDPVMWRNGKKFVPRQGKYGPDLFTNWLIRFMRRNQNGPFLAYYPMVLPHAPFRPTPLDRDRRSKPGKHHFASMMEYMDTLVGKLINALEEMGLRENTLVLFTSDNGTDKKIRSRQNGVYVRGGKQNMTGRSCNVPLIANQPGVVPAGRTLDDLVDLSDFLPTLVDLAGAKLPESVTIDGRSFAPRILGQSQLERDWIYIERGNERTIMDKRYKLNGDGSFYDIKRDPYEQSPLGSDADAQALLAKARLKWSLSQLK